MSTLHHFIINQKAKALSEGIKIVRDILKSNPFPNGFTTSQLFEVAVKQPPPPDFPVYHDVSLPPKIKPNGDRFRKIKPIQSLAPSHPEHPIRSIRFLKTEILPSLRQSSEIKMVRQNRLAPVEMEKVQKGRDPTIEFVWKVVDPNEVPPPRPKPKKEVVGMEVGVGLDYDHLNKRRQNARVGKIARDVETMKSLKHTWSQVPPPSRTEPKEEEVEVESEFSVDSDYGHLNERPENARVGKTARDGEAMNSFKHTWRREVAPHSRSEPKEEVVRRGFGVDSDYRHLNKHRENARAGKITRDVEAMKSWRQERTTERVRKHWEVSPQYKSN